MNDSAEELKPGEASAIYLTLHADITALYPFEEVQGTNAVSYSDPTILAPNARRSLVRAVFAFIEGCLYVQRRMLLKSWGARLSEADRLALSELQVEVTAHGTVQTRPMRIGALNLIRLTIQSFVSAVPNAMPIKCEGAGFEALVRAMKVRDRLMHPKTVASLGVGESEIKDALDAFFWVEQILSVMTAASTSAMRRSLVDDHGIELHVDFARPSETRVGDANSYGF